MQRVILQSQMQSGEQMVSITDVPSLGSKNYSAAQIRCASNPRLRRALTRPSRTNPKRGPAIHTWSRSIILRHQQRRTALRLPLACVSTRVTSSASGARRRNVPPQTPEHSSIPQMSDGLAFTDGPQLLFPIASRASNRD